MAEALTGTAEEAGEALAVVAFWASDRRMHSSTVANSIWLTVAEMALSQWWRLVARESVIAAFQKAVSGS